MENIDIVAGTDIEANVEPIALILGEIECWEVTNILEQHRSEIPTILCDINRAIMRLLTTIVNPDGCLCDVDTMQHVAKMYGHLSVQLNEVAGDIKKCEFITDSDKEALILHLGAAATKLDVLGKDIQAAQDVIHECGAHIHTIFAHDRSFLEGE